MRTVKPISAEIKMREGLNRMAREIIDALHDSCTPTIAALARGAGYPADNDPNVTRREPSWNSTALRISEGLAGGELTIQTLARLLAAFGVGVRVTLVRMPGDGPREEELIVTTEPESGL